MKKKATIDLQRYLQDKGSPLAQYVPAIIRSANKYRIDPRLLVAIAGGETSFATNGEGPSVYNAWGIGPGRAYSSWQDGIEQAAKLLRNNYIGKGLTSLSAIQRKWAPIAASNDPRNLNSNWLRVNGQFYTELGGNVNNVTLGWRNLTSPKTVDEMTGVPLTPKIKQPLLPDWSNVRAAAQQNLSDIASGKFLKPTEQMAGLTSAAAVDKSAFDQLKAMSVVPSGEPGVGRVTGKGKPVKSTKGMLVTSKGWKETSHAGGRTSGLGWGDDVPADLMGPPGQPIGAPTSGTITRIGSAQEGGQSIYLMGDDGYEYWLGHIDVDLPVGARVQTNQVIASISGEHPRPHLHITRRRVK